VGASGFGPQSLSRRALLVWLLLAAVAASAQPSAPETEIKGAFLAKLSQYIEWPAATFATADQPIVIGILGEDPFGPEFDVSLRTLKVAGRTVRARRLRRVEEAKGCHLLYVSPSENGNLRAILTALRSQPILTAGDYPEFLKLGGALRFWRKGESIAFHISEAALREAKLIAHPRLLQLSDDPSKPR
jgi:YfiR/HmsC-like